MHSGLNTLLVSAVTEIASYSGAYLPKKIESIKVTSSVFLLNMGGIPSIKLPLFRVMNREERQVHMKVAHESSHRMGMSSILVGLLWQNT